MKRFAYDDYEELIELIPVIQESALKGLKRDMFTQVYNAGRIKRRADMYKEIFKLIQGKWTIEIFYAITIFKNCGFNDIRRALPKINARTLTDRLHFLEKRRMIIRTIRKTRPIRVNYTLSDSGKSAVSLLIPFLLFFILPRRYTNKFEEIKEIENRIDGSIEEEIETGKIYRY